MGYFEAWTHFCTPTQDITTTFYIKLDVLWLSRFDNNQPCKGTTILQTGNKAYAFEISGSTYTDKCAFS
jgi:hypothetical protein